MGADPRLRGRPGADRGGAGARTPLRAAPSPPRHPAGGPGRHPLRPRRGRDQGPDRGRRARRPDHRRLGRDHRPLRHPRPVHGGLGPAARRRDRDDRADGPGRQRDPDSGRRPRLRRPPLLRSARRRPPVLGLPDGLRLGAAAPGRGPGGPTRASADRLLRAGSASQSPPGPVDDLIPPAAGPIRDGVDPAAQRRRPEEDRRGGAEGGAGEHVARIVDPAATRPTESTVAKAIATIPQRGFRRKIATAIANAAVAWSLGKLGSAAWAMKRCS